MNKIILAIAVTLSLSTDIFAQIVVKGSIIDAEENPWTGGHISFENKGCVSDEFGHFSLSIPNGEEIIIQGIEIVKHKIYNLHSEKDTIHLGNIKLLDLGFEGYVTYSKKRFLTGKEYSKCEYVDNRTEPAAEMLMVKCEDGQVRYTWNWKSEENEVELDFHTIKSCQ